MTMIRKPATVLLMAAMLTLSFGSYGCGKDDLEKAKQTAEQVLIAIDAGQQFSRDLVESQVLDAEQGAIVETVIRQLKDAATAFVHRARTYDKFDAASKADLSKLFADVVSGVNTLNEKGAFYIKNPEKMARFRRIMTGLVLAARWLQASLGRNPDEIKPVEP